MFEPTKPFYMTRAVAEELSAEHRQFIVSYLYECHNELTDYFQVFEFSITKKKQLLRQKQEQPQLETKIFVMLKETKSILRTVWAMDQLDHVMILFPEDY